MKYIGPLTEEHTRIREEYLERTRDYNLQKFLGILGCSETMAIRNNPDKIQELRDKYL